MDELMRVMTPKPRNAETPKSYLRSWITANSVFFDRNQGEIPEKLIDLAIREKDIGGDIYTIRRTVRGADYGIDIMKFYNSCVLQYFFFTFLNFVVFFNFGSFSTYCPKCQNSFKSPSFLPFALSFPKET